MDIAMPRKERCTGVEHRDFDVSVDPFYDPANLAHIRRGLAQLDRGEGQEHELLEDEP